jgi:hypothetical protein
MVLKEKEKEQDIASDGEDLPIVNEALTAVEKSQKADKKRQSHIKIGKRDVVFREFFTKVISPLKKFIEFVDKVIVFDVSGKAALPWAGIKLILQVE